MKAIFLLYAIGHLGLFVLALRHFLRLRFPETVPLLLVTAGLVYDNALLAGGEAIGFGEQLQHLSVPRFFMHAVATPLLMLSALGLVQRTDANWARSGLAVVLITALTLAMIAVGFFVDMISLNLEPKRAGDIVSYGNAAASGPPVAATVTILVLIAAGVEVWRRSGAPWVFAGSAVQFLAAALGDAVVFAGNLGELALMAGLVAADRQLSENSH